MDGEMGENHTSIHLCLLTFLLALRLDCVVARFNP